MALQYIGRFGERELFVLAVVVAALGIAAGATLFDVSLALGAFIAGVTISESETSTQAAADVVPLREAFAVLFFVGVGLLLDFGTLLDNLDLFAVVLVLVLVVNATAAIVATSFTTFPARTGFVVAAGLSNVGEFSFIIVNQALDDGTISDDTYSVILATSVITIALTRLTFEVHERLARRAARTGFYRRRRKEEAPPARVEHVHDHVVVAGYGRVGQLLVHALASAGVPAVAVESNLMLARRANDAGIPAVWGDAANDEVLIEAHVQAAVLLVIAVPDESTTVLAIANARRLNPDIFIVARAHGPEELKLYYDLGAAEVVVPEYEGGLELMERTLTALGFDSKEALAFMHAQRDIHYGAVGHTSDVHVHAPH
jgi:CPA2 family monovalent cation:H+ antiporter-2